MDARVIELIKADVGLRLKPYSDMEGVLTIGYGRNLVGVGISRDEAERLFVNDCQRVERELSRCWPWLGGLDAVRYGVLCCMGFQLGLVELGRLVEMMEAVRADDYQWAARQMLESRWHRQTPARWERLAEMMRSGCWPGGAGAAPG